MKGYLLVFVTSILVMMTVTVWVVGVVSVF